jgi:hypothetical protein
MRVGAGKYAVVVIARDHSRPPTGRRARHDARRNRGVWLHPRLRVAGLNDLKEG